MATWPSGTKASTTNLDAGTDSPASARADIKQNTDNVNSIIDMFNIATPSNNQILKYNTTNTRFELASDVDTGITDVVQDTTPQLGGNLDVNGNSIVSASNGNIVIAPDGTGDVHLNADSVRIGDNNADATLATRGTGDLILTTHEGSGTEGVIRIYDGANGNITLTPNGTGNLVLDGLNWPQADGTADYVLKTNGSAQLSWVAQPTAFNPATPGAIGGTTASTGTFTTLTVNAANDLRLADTDSSNYVGFKAPATVATNKIWTLPSADGSANQVLSTDGSGTLSWTTVSGGFPIIAIRQGNGAGTLISGTTYRVPITETADTGSLISISGNQFTLPAGTYLIQNPTYPNLSSNTTAIQLYNVTDAELLFRAVIDAPFGASYYMGFAGQGIVTIGANKTVELRISHNSSSVPDPYSFTGLSDGYCDWILIKLA